VYGLHGGCYGLVTDLARVRSNAHTHVRGVVGACARPCTHVRRYTAVGLHKSLHRRFSPCESCLPLAVAFGALRGLMCCVNLVGRVYVTSGGLLRWRLVPCVAFVTPTHQVDTTHQTTQGTKRHRKIHPDNTKTGQQTPRRLVDRLVRGHGQPCPEAPTANTGKHRPNRTIHLGYICATLWMGAGVTFLAPKKKTGMPAS
jgi:hypothetical protein